jgi:hypothetical protein
VCSAFRGQGREESLGLFCVSLGFTHPILYDGCNCFFRTLALGNSSSLPEAGMFGREIFDQPEFLRNRE